MSLPYSVDQLYLLEVVFKHEDKEKWATETFGPFKGHFGAMAYYDAFIQPKLEFGANVTTRRLSNPGQSLGIQQTDWIKQFS